MCLEEKAVDLFRKGQGKSGKCKACEAKFAHEKVLAKKEKAAEKREEERARGEKTRQDLLDPTKRLQPGEPRPDIDATIRSRYYGK